MSGGGRNESQLMLICGGKFSQKNMRIDHRKFRVHLQFNFIKFYCNMFHQFSKIKEEKLAKLCKSLRYQSSFFFANKQFFWNISLQKKLEKIKLFGGDCLSIYGLRHTGSFHLATRMRSREIWTKFAVYGQTVGLVI